MCTTSSSSIQGHLGCFYVLAIVIVLLLGYIYLFELKFSLDICPGVGSQNHVATLLLVFLRKLHIIFHSQPSCINHYFLYFMML